MKESGLSSPGEVSILVGKGIRTQFQSLNSPGEVLIGGGETKYQKKKFLLQVQCFVPEIVSL